LVLDVLMPGLDGFAFLKGLREHPAGPAIPAIVWTNEDLRASTCCGCGRSLKAWY